MGQWICRVVSFLEIRHFGILFDADNDNLPIGVGILAIVCAEFVFCQTIDEYLNIIVRVDVL